MQPRVDFFLPDTTIIMTQETLILRGVTVINYNNQENLILVRYEEFDQERLLLKFNSSIAEPRRGDILYVKCQALIREGKHIEDSFGPSKTNYDTPETYKVYKPIKTPVIIISDALSIVKSTINAILKNRNFGNSQKRLGFIKKLAMFAKSHKLKLNDYMNHLANYYEMYSRLDNSYIISEALNTKEGRKIHLLLKDWLKDRLYRQFGLLGISRAQAKTSLLARPREGRNLAQLFEETFKNPYTPLGISLKHAEILNDILNKKFDTPKDHKMHQIAANIARVAYSELINHNNIYIPKPRGVDTIMPILEKTYGMVADNGLYLPYPYEVETGVASYLQKCLNHGLDNSKLLQLSNMTYSNSDLTQEQCNAVRGSLKCPINIITGGAGTGKTTTINELVKQIKRLRSNVLVCSFTGKAVSRLRKEIVDDGQLVELSTIDLAISSQKTHYEFVIVDETSMVSTELFYRFIQTVMEMKPANLTFVGDNNQLPPISWGHLFTELNANNRIFRYTLTKNLRSNVAGDNGIVINSQNLVNYHLKREKDLTFNKYNNFHFLPGNEDSVVQMCQLVLNKIPQGFEKRKIKVICPYRAPSDRLNLRLQRMTSNETFNISDDWNMKWTKDSIVVCKENNYHNKVMNGDEGIITWIDTMRNTFKVKFFNGSTKTILTRYDSSKYATHLFSRNIRYSYCTTVHGSQGDEWEYVILYLPATSNRHNFINYKMIYTAITRPRRIIWVFGDREQLIGMSKTSIRKPNERLSQRLV